MHGMLSAGILIAVFALTATAALYVAVRVHLAGRYQAGRYQAGRYQGGGYQGGGRPAGAPEPMEGS
jgi:hypothetical protein